MPATPGTHACGSRSNRRIKEAKAAPSNPDMSATLSAPPLLERAGSRSVSRGHVIAAVAALLAGTVGVEIARKKDEDGGWVQSLLVLQMRGMGDYERFMRPKKSILFREAFQGLKAQRVVEVGVGLGVNFSFLREAGVKQLVAVEPNQHFTSSALNAAKTEGLQLVVQNGVMEALPFETASVDVIVGTFLLCSVSDVDQAVAEAFRVLRPGGRYIFTEHTAASSGSWLVMAQSFFDSAQQTVAGGCHLTRDPLPVIKKTFGSQQVFAERGQLGDGNNPFPPHFLLSPHVVGYAVKA